MRYASQSGQNLDNCWEVFQAVVYRAGFTIILHPTIPFTIAPPDAVTTIVASNAAGRHKRQVFLFPSLCRRRGIDWPRRPQHESGTGACGIAILGYIT
jgi:hypothetical protein